MESQDFRALISRSAELRDRSAQARQISVRIIAESRQLVIRTELLLDVTGRARARRHGSAGSEGLSAYSTLVPGPDREP
jgi:hypothetical protein